jgi:hypothetical protein
LELGPGLDESVLLDKAEQGFDIEFDKSAFEKDGMGLRFLEHYDGMFVGGVKSLLRRFKLFGPYLEMCECANNEIL